MWESIFCRWTILSPGAVVASACFSSFLLPKAHFLSPAHSPSSSCSLIWSYLSVCLHPLGCDLLLGWTPWKAKILPFNSLFLKLGMGWCSLGFQGVLFLFCMCPSSPFHHPAWGRWSLHTSWEVHTSWPWLLLLQLLQLLRTRAEVGKQSKGQSLPWECGVVKRERWLTQG